MDTPPAPHRRRNILAAIAAVLAAVIALIAAINGPDPEPSPAPAPTATVVTLGGPGNAKVQLPPAAQTQAKAQANQAAAGDDQAAHSDLRESTPQPPDVVAANDGEKPAGQEPIPANPPLAAQNVPGCRTLLVRNFSSRNGAPILLFVIHYTVSIDNGWTGVLANVRWFDTAAASASSTYIQDRRTGACALTVAEHDKAWAQAGFNPWALSVEVTANGKEGSLVEGAGRARLLSLMQRAHRVYKIPYRHGAVSGCKVTRTGFVIHKDLGQCGGGHVDTTPYSIDPLIAAAAAGDHPVTSTDRLTCRRLNWWREHGRPSGKARTNAIRRREALERRGVSCLKTAPGRR